MIAISKNSRVLADTGPLYALADPSDQYHTRSHEELDRLIDSGQSVAVTFLTLAETYTLILRRLGTPYAHRWLQQLIDGSVLINPEPRDFLLAFDLIRTFRDQSVTVFDAVAAAVGNRLSLAVWTYDRHFDLFRIQRWT
jgi:predicted nucleic acid-binding protein